MSYREGGVDTPAADMRSFMCMRSFVYEVGGNKENIEAHQWLNAMRKDGWHLVSMSTAIGKVTDNMSGHGGQSNRTFDGNVITFVMEGTKHDPNHKSSGQYPDPLSPVRDALVTTTTYGSGQW
jgi:hypothetical protein